jgi:uncharacterized protein YndB with AHSA1/START domain
MKPAPVRSTTPADDRVIVTQRLDAPFGPAWAALTEPALVSQWLTSCTALSARRYALQFTDTDGDYVKTAEVTMLRHRPDQACYRVLLHDPGYPDSLVTVQLRALDGGTSSVRLTHHDPPAQLLAGYRSGWRDYLAGLAELLGSTHRATGTAGRNGGAYHDN